MFQVTIVNDKDQKIEGSLDLNAPPAEYFAACVYIAVDTLNGGNDLIASCKKRGLDTSKHNTMLAQHHACANDSYSFFPW